MSPRHFPRRVQGMRLPRTCGDEPEQDGYETYLHEVCPAPAGMSRDGRRVLIGVASLPRTCGDEPRGNETSATTRTSAPHLRG